eukprot:scaffold187064_cov18-Tisochrysis_lutea.AAC.1
MEPHDMVAPHACVLLRRHAEAGKNVQLHRVASAFVRHVCGVAMCSCSGKGISSKPLNAFQDSSDVQKLLRDEQSACNAIPADCDLCDVQGGIHVKRHIFSSALLMLALCASSTHLYAEALYFPFNLFPLIGP